MRVLFFLFFYSFLFCFVFRLYLSDSAFYGRIVSKLVLYAQSAGTVISGRRQNRTRNLEWEHDKSPQLCDAKSLRGPVVVVVDSDVGSRHCS